MKTLLLLGMLSLAMGLLLPVWAAPTPAPPPSTCPFTEQGLAKLSLTPAQAVIAHRIAQGVQHGLLVQDPVSQMWPELQLGQSAGHDAKPLDQVIAENRARLVALLFKPHPSQREVQSLAREIAVQELTLSELVNGSMTALSSILTPEQRTHLQECPRVAKMTM